MQSNSTMGPIVSQFIFNFKGITVRKTSSSPAEIQEISTLASTETLFLATGMENLHGQ